MHLKPYMVKTFGLQRYFEFPKPTQHPQVLILPTQCKSPFLFQPCFLLLPHRLQDYFAGDGVGGVAAIIGLNIFQNAFVTIAAHSVCKVSLQ
ncbi:TPA: hypothetical protein JD337_001736 [Citrobacter freundii]|nr:hypothetical protein [Citrobacter freundii]